MTPVEPTTSPALVHRIDAPRRRSHRGLLLVSACLLSAAVGATGARMTAPTSAVAAPLGAAPTASTAPVKQAASIRLVGSAATAAGEASIIKVAANVGPAVVTVLVGGNVNAGGQSATSSGSGVIIRKDGWILTNRHVVEGVRNVSVILADGRTFKGAVKALASDADLALLKVTATKLPIAPLGDSTELQVGQEVVAIGSPLGEFPGSVTAGVISGLDRSLTVSGGGRQTRDLQHLIQVDAAINPGSDGGPLLDLDGTVIGIATAEARDGQGIGFALPVGLATSFIARSIGG